MAALALRRVASRAGLARRAREGLPTGAALGATALTFLSNGVAGVLVARRLGPAAYGHVAYALAAFGLVTLLGSLGLATRVVSAAAGRPDLPDSALTISSPSLGRRGGRGSPLGGAEAPPLGPPYPRRPVAAGEGGRRRVHRRRWGHDAVAPFGDEPGGARRRPAGGAKVAVASVELLALARATTLLPIALAGALAVTLFHADAIAVACAAGALALARSFLAAAIAGSGGVALAACIESVQGVLYLALLLAFRAASPPVVFAALLSSHLAPLPVFVAAAARRGLVRFARIRRGAWREQASATLGALGGVYALTVTIAAQAPWMAFILGKTGHLAETAYLNVGLSLSGLAPSVCLAVHANLYFPRLCRLLATNAEPAATRYARVWCRRFLAAGLASAVLLTASPAAVIRALYAQPYQDAAGVAAVAGWVALVMLLEQALAWNLIARGHVASALRPAAAQCLIMVAGGAAAVAWSREPLGALLAVYVGAALVGWLLMLATVRRIWPGSAATGAMHAAAALALAAALVARAAPLTALVAAAPLPALAALAISARREPGA